MKCREPGVLEKSEYFFATPSNLAKKLFFYPLCSGEFFCGEKYHVNRKNYNSYLIMLILEGSLTVQSEGKEFIAEAGDVVFLDCYHPHKYFSDSPLHFLFLHFDGNVSSEFYETVCKAKENVFTPKDSDVVQTILTSVYNDMRSHILSEALQSCRLQTLLCEILSSASTQTAQHTYSEGTETARNYIENNFAESLTVNQMAAIVNISVYHFSRVFKLETGYSPHEYLVKCRIDRAKHLLKSCQKPVSEIAFEVGFQSESNFIYAFRDKVGLSPNKFRKMPF